MQVEVMIKAFDGGTFDAVAVFPQDPKPAPAVVVIQEIWGVNGNMRAICASLAQAGLVAICPDLFWRQERGVQLTGKTESEWQKGMQLLQDFDTDRGVEDLKATIDFIRKHKGCTGKVGTMGYCLGGKLAYLTATRSDADCNVSYYGVGIDDLLNEAGNIKHPLMMHIAEKDKFVPAEAQQKIVRALEQHSQVQVFVYAGVDHGFARKNSDDYVPAAAEQADSRSTQFLATCLGRTRV